MVVMKLTDHLSANEPTITLRSLLVHSSGASYDMSNSKLGLLTTQLMKNHQSIQVPRLMADLIIYWSLN